MAPTRITVGGVQERDPAQREGLEVAPAVAEGGGRTPELPPGCVTVPPFEGQGAEAPARQRGGDHVPRLLSKREGAEQMRLGVSEAAVQMGEAPVPDAEHHEKDLDGARQTIDILSMLESKTQGNLTPAEANLLRNLIRDLRLRYVRSGK